MEATANWGKDRGSLNSTDNQHVDMWKSFMALQNQRIQLLNEHAASFNKKMAIPFSGHQKMEIPALLNLLVKWALEFKVNIVNPPKPINGKVGLFTQHIQYK